MNILFIAARFPYPLLKGDQVRAYHQLKILGKRHRITLLCFAEQDVSPAERAEVEQHCEKVVVIPLRRRQMLWGLICGISTSYPLQTLLFRTAAMRAAVRREIETRKFDLAYVQLVRMAPYVEKETQLPRVIDFVDAISLNMARRANQEHGLRHWAVKLEEKRLQRYERWLCEKFDHATVVSPIDRDAIGDYANLHINANGVDLKAFAYNEGPRQPNTLIFSGNMCYLPNINAVAWFTNEVLPLIKKEVPDVHFKIVGTNPHPVVRALTEQDSCIEVTGFVPSVQEHLSQAAIAIAPMQGGAGIQNKVIEAMACGTPIVATSYAMGGIKGRDGEHLLIANDAPSFADQVLRLMREPELCRSLSQNAYQLVKEEYAWENYTSQLEDIYSKALKQPELCEVIPLPISAPQQHTP